MDNNNMNITNRNANDPNGKNETFVAVRKNGDGDIVELKTSTGRVLDYKAAQQEVQKGIIIGANVFTGRDGDPHLRSNADGDPSNNLDNLPQF